MAPDRAAVAHCFSGFSIRENIFPGMWNLAVAVCFTQASLTEKDNTEEGMMFLEREATSFLLRQSAVTWLFAYHLCLCIFKNTFQPLNWKAFVEAGGKSLQKQNSLKWSQIFTRDWHGGNGELGSLVLLIEDLIKQLIPSLCGFHGCKANSSAGNPQDFSLGVSCRTPRLFSAGNPQNASLILPPLVLDFPGLLEMSGG